MEFRKGGVFVEYFNEEKSTRLTTHSRFGLRTDYRTLCVHWNGILRLNGTQCSSVPVRCPGVSSSQTRQKG